MIDIYNILYYKYKNYMTIEKKKRMISDEPATSGYIQPL